MFHFLQTKNDFTNVFGNYIQHTPFSKFQTFPVWFLITLQGPGFLSFPNLKRLHLRNQNFSNLPKEKLDTFPNLPSLAFKMRNQTSHIPHKHKRPHIGEKKLVACNTWLIILRFRETITTTSQLYSQTLIYIGFCFWSYSDSTCFQSFLNLLFSLS